MEKFKRSLGSFAVPLLSILLAFLIGGIIMAALGADPFQAVKYLFQGAFGSRANIGTTLNKSTPLMFTALCACFAYKCGVFNLGGEGQFLMGSIAAFLTAYFSGLTGFAGILLALLASYFLKHTRPGLHLRAVGESASTADAAGINVTKYKYLATCIGSMIAGLGGLYYVMDYASGVWSNNAFGDRGWLAIALVIFTIWRPNVSVLASILFGGFYILYLYIPTGTNLAIKELYKMLPYVVTLAVLIIVSLRKKREDQPPASLGLSFFREER